MKTSRTPAVPLHQSKEDVLIRLRHGVNRIAYIASRITSYINVNVDGEMIVEGTQATFRNIRFPGTFLREGSKSARARLAFSCSLTEDPWLITDAVESPSLVARQRWIDVALVSKLGRRISVGLNLPE